MKKIFSIAFILLLLCSSFLFAKGSVIKIQPENFKDSIIVHNETEKEILVYLYIQHGDDTKKYKSEIATIKSYRDTKIDFDYDCEWHDLVKDLRKFFETIDKDANSYTFEFHFSEDEIYISKTQISGKCYHVYIKSNNKFDF